MDAITHPCFTSTNHAAVRIYTPQKPMLVIPYTSWSMLVKYARDWSFTGAWISLTKGQ